MSGNQKAHVTFITSAKDGCLCVFYKQCLCSKTYQLQNRKGISEIFPEK